MSFSLGREEPVVEPGMFVGDRRLPDRALIIFTEVMSRSVDNYVDDRFDIKWISGNRVIRCRYRDTDLVVAYPFFGAPATIFAMELLVAAGVKYFVVVGEAASLTDQLDIGDYVLPTWGVREEGTSYHYMPSDYVPRPDEYLYGLLRSVVDGYGGGRRVMSGGIWSIDAIFRETRDKIRRYSDMGVLCIDMESTAIMALGGFRGVSTAILVVISDLVYGDEWVTGWGSRVLDEAEDQAIEAGLETIRLIG